MELLLLLRVLLRRWWLVLLPIVIVVALTLPQFINQGSAVSGGYLVRFQYSAAQETSNLPNREGDFQDVWLASEYLINAFTDWVRGSAFRAELAQLLGPEIDLGPLSIGADNARSVGVVEMQHSDALTLERIATAAIEVMSERSAAYFPQLGGEPAEIAILDAPVVVPLAPSLPNRFLPFIQWGLAVLLGIVLAIVAHYFDPILRDASELERMGIRTLAHVPRQR